MRMSVADKDLISVASINPSGFMTASLTILATSVYSLNSQLTVPSYTASFDRTSRIEIPLYTSSQSLQSTIQLLQATPISDLSGRITIPLYTSESSLESQIYVQTSNQRRVANMKFLTSLNLSNNELQNALLHKLSSAPGSATAGYVYYNTTDNQVYVYNGTAFVEMTNLSASELLDAIKTVDGASSGLDADLLDGQEGTWYQSRDNHTGTQLASTISDFDTQVRTSRLDQMAIPTADVNLNSNKITNLATPTQDTDAANKAYVDAVKQGLDVKDSVRVATTANIDLTTGGTLTVDGVSLTAGDRVLVKAQTTASQNGIYIVNAGAWTRATDANTADKINGGMFTFVEEGTVNGDTGWVLIVDGAVTLGTTELSYVQFSAAGQIIAGDGLTKTGITINAVGTADRISVNADSIDIASTYVGQASITTLGTITTGTWNGTTIAVVNGGTGATDAGTARANLGATTKYSATIGDGSATSFTVTHNFNTEDVVIIVREAANDKYVVFPDIRVTGANTVSVSFGVAPSSNEYRVTVIG